MQRRYLVVDVFGARAFSGNPVAVVADAEGLSTEAMQRIASWTNLSETTFLLPADVEGADYSVRIFTTTTELPFAGHPTLGAARAWLEHGNLARTPGCVVQSCAAGLVKVFEQPGGALAFEAPPLLRSGPLSSAELQACTMALGLEAHQVLDGAWVDNGPGWCAVLVESVETLHSLAVPSGVQKLGAVALGVPQGTPAYELRAFFPSSTGTTEDPVTGSLNASVAQWLCGAGLVQPPYQVHQGAALGRDGIIEVTESATGALLVGGQTAVVVRGTIEA